MILSFRSQEYGLERFVVCPSGPVTVDELRERMLDRARVARGSYAYRLVEDLHSAIFLQSLDLKADFETYFAREYESFGDFVRRRTRIPSAVIDQIVASVELSSGIYYVKRSFDFLSETRGLELLEHLLEDLPLGKTA